MSSSTVIPPLQRLAAQAARDPERVLTTLAHLIGADFLREAYRQPRTSRAPGLEGVTAKRAAEPLDDDRRDWHERRCRGRDPAAPVARVWSAKDEGGRGPLGKPAFEAKSVQRAVAMRLEASDEQDVDDGS